MCLHLPRSVCLLTQCSLVGHQLHNFQQQALVALWTFLLHHTGFEPAHLLSEPPVRFAHQSPGLGCLGEQSAKLSTPYGDILLPSTWRCPQSTAFIDRRAARRGLRVSAATFLVGAPGKLVRPEARVCVPRRGTHRGTTGGRPDGGRRGEGQGESGPAPKPVWILGRGRPGPNAWPC